MSPRSQNARGEVTRAILCGNLREKCRTPSPKEQFFVEICRKSAGPRSRGACFVRTCAVETHMGISQERFCVEIYRNNAAHCPPRSNTGPFTVTVRNPSVWPRWHCLGNSYGKKLYMACIAVHQTPTFIRHISPCIVTLSPDGPLILCRLILPCIIS